MHKEFNLHQNAHAQMDNTKHLMKIATIVLSDVLNVHSTQTIVMMENVHTLPELMHQIVFAQMDISKLMDKLNVYNVNPNVKLAQDQLIIVSNVEMTENIMPHYAHVSTDNSKTLMPTKLSEIVTTRNIFVQELLEIVIFVLKIELTHLNAHAQMDTLIMELLNAQNVAQLVKLVKPPIATVKNVPMTEKP